LVQKTPVVRLQQADSSDYAYYLDPQGNTIEWSEQYSPRLPVASVPALGYGHEDYKLKTSLVQLAQFIQTDSFWNAAIAQIVVNDQYEIQLIPIMGKQLIRLGDTRDLQDKMNRLLRFYQEGVHKFPWDKYDELDLRFSKQIVCRNNRGEILAEDPYDDKSKMIVRKLDASSKQQTLVSNASKSKKINNEVKKETPSKKNPAANPTSKKNNAQKTTQIKPNSLKQ
jgi:cell division protein FtsQ